MSNGYDDFDIVHCNLCGAPVDLCTECILVEAHLPEGRCFNDPAFMGCGQLKLCPTCAAVCTEAIRNHYHDAGVCEHGEREGDWCPQCNAAYKMARVENCALD
jgi:hypothetical protein